tara:strand:+ start:320 stop:544 length:225 start_codon:yes stop_codon:yes gene_type:complete
MKKKEYRIEVVTESALSTFFLGSAKMPTRKIEETMNRFGLQGWEVVFQVIEKRRMLLFWNREAMVITFSRELKD